MWIKRDLTFLSFKVSSSHSHSYSLHVRQFVTIDHYMEPTRYQLKSITSIVKLDLHVSRLSPASRECFFLKKKSETIVGVFTKCAIFASHVNFVFWSFENLAVIEF